MIKKKFQIFADGEGGGAEGGDGAGTQQEPAEPKLLMISSKLVITRPNLIDEYKRRSIQQLLTPKRNGEP